jgi:hypothetical protein
MTLRCLCLAVLAFATAPIASRAAPIYATWTLDNLTTATGSLPDGRSATFTGFPTAASAGGGGTVTPALPGIPSGDRPPTLTFFPTDVGGDPNAGDLFFTLDLGLWGIDAETSFSLEDLVDTSLYRLELQDASFTPLTLAGVQLSQHNLFFSGGAVSDYDLSLDPATGTITVVQVHDSGDPAAGRHSGLAVFSNLPANTRYVRLFVGLTGSSLRDGLRLTLSASAPLPEPSALALLAASLVGARYARGSAKR